ncbi:MAG: DegT/DnrJ/EryC1/StrS family aminotransferase [Candidatus Diapherotrites archaeon]|nr:DegT/DnrJ/EryC1/StrS family aminotransferase [Candidatus Diapherotrites archaeon]
MLINVFVPKFHTEEVLEEIRQCLDKGWTGVGFKTVEFEEKWKEYVGIKNAHFLNSNTAGLHLAVRVLKKKFGWKNGDEIITTPLTFVSTNHAILYENLKPVFADVDQYLCLDPKSVESKITKKTKAVMFVGIGGNTGKYLEIVKLCKKHGLKLILDAAHMAGTKINGKHVGSEADVAVFSFQAIKNLPTSDSGMICFADDGLDKKAWKLSWMGISKDTYKRFNNNKGGYKWKYDVEDVGFKYHGNAVAAAIALVQLKYLEEDNSRRREIAALYDKLLEGVKGVEIVRTAPDCVSSRHLYQICVNNRDEIMQYFYDNDIYPGVHYTDNTEYKMYSYAKGSCPNAHKKSEQLITLPIHLRLKDSECKKVVEVLLEGLKKFSK